jgi:hypothetical protein
MKLVDNLYTDDGARRAIIVRYVLTAVTLALASIAYLIHRVFMRLN